MLKEFTEVYYMLISDNNQITTEDMAMSFTSFHQGGYIHITALVSLGMFLLASDVSVLIFIDIVCPGQLPQGFRFEARGCV